MKKVFVILLLLSSLLSSANANTIPIPADKAFQFSAELKSPNTIVAHWQITPGYYLYKDRISFKVLGSNGVSLGPIVKPVGIDKSDRVLGQYQVYNGNLRINLPLQRAHANTLELLACFQGCSFDNFCYPPMTKQVTLHLKNDVGKTIQGIDAELPDAATDTLISSQDKISQLLAEHDWWLIAISFFGFGLLLSLTPCVLPMIPILSGIIIGHGEKMTALKGFFLSLTYVLGMAITYAIIGVITGLAGSSVQAAMQNPWVITVFSLVFVVLALSLFGLYEIKLPARFEQRITTLSNHQKQGSYWGVVIMGILSTLILSPCVTAPLIGALIYIGNTGNAALGASALFIMALGMGVPLLIIGTFGGKFLPTAGTWMDVVKIFFGVLLLAVAIWMLARILPGTVTMVLWAGLLIVCAVYMGLFNGKKYSNRGWALLWRGLSLIFLVYGIMLMIGAAMGNSNPFRPLEDLRTLEANGIVPTHKLFTRIKTPADLQHELNLANNENKLTMLDFYAEWCIACKEMDATTFVDPKVQKLLLQHFFILQADVTANDKMDKVLMKKSGVIAPPAILFFDKDGKEIKPYRIVGEISPKKFAEHLRVLVQQR